MTTLDLARKLDACLAAQVKLQKERDLLKKTLGNLIDIARIELFSGNRRSDAFQRFEEARAALAQVQS